jgi:hypothetical protein
MKENEWKNPQMEMDKMTLIDIYNCSYKCNASYPNEKTQFAI